MRLPEKKQKELEKKGKHKSPPLRGGGAAGRLHQFEIERGLEETDLENPAAEESSEGGGDEEEISDQHH